MSTRGDCIEHLRRLSFSILEQDAPSPPALPPPAPSPPFGIHGETRNFPNGINEGSHCYYRAEHNDAAARPEGIEEVLLEHVWRCRLTSLSASSFVHVQLDGLKMLAWTTLWRAFCSGVSAPLNICGDRSSIPFFCPSHLRSNLSGSYLADSYR